MKIIYKRGNLLDAPEPFVAHGCNSRGVMGSGVAAAIRAEYPKAYTEYRKTYEEQGNVLALGTIIPVQCDPHWVINAITQEFFGSDPNVRYVDYLAVRTCIHTINEFVKEHGHANPTVAFPLIGAGLANGDWAVISQIIEEASTDFQPVVYLIDGIIPHGVEGEVIPL